MHENAHLVALSTGFLTFVERLELIMLHERSFPSIRSIEC